MSASIPFPRVAETVSARIHAWLSAGSQGISRRRRLEIASRSGSLVSLAAAIVERAGADNLPVRIAVAPPLNLQPAVFVALSSEIHYLADLPVRLNFVRQGFRRPARWATPRAIAQLLPFFASIPKAEESNRGEAVRLIFSEFTANPDQPVDFLLWAGTEPTREAPGFENSISVQLAPLYM